MINNCNVSGDIRVQPSPGAELSVDMPDIYYFGDWGGWDTCATGSYTAGIQLTVTYQHQHSDTRILMCLLVWIVYQMK